MAASSSEENGSGRNSSQMFWQDNDTPETCEAWRSFDQVENCTPSTSPLYWDSDEDDDGGLKPSELYGKYTWKIEKFSQINKRELRSNPFEVGGYKWYILIYPQGCDVCNHLSLFLCVANHDKLLPGWSHFAQFTIAVVNKDPKKSKYSDTLHRFWKKEHDWGWKKFMELSKVPDGFLDTTDTLIIKAQVQVIREKADRPFRCLDCQYRRELVRVYLTNVEQICRRFVEDRRGKLVRLIEDKIRWSSFCAFWLGMDESSRQNMSREKTDVILRVVVKNFFIEKEVTSTLVMDSLYSGLKALEGQNKRRNGKSRVLDNEEIPSPNVLIENDMFVLVDDVLLLLEKAAVEPLPPKDEKGPQNRTKDGCAGEDVYKDSIERDEKRLTELGRRTMEIFILAHIFIHKIEVAYQEAIALQRQEELIREEEEAWIAGIELRARRGATEKEKKSKKKQAKQKRNNRKSKEKVQEGKACIKELHSDELPNGELDRSDEFANPVVPKPEDLSELSDSALTTRPFDQISENGDADAINLDMDDNETLSLSKSESNENGHVRAASNGIIEVKDVSAPDDSSSTCSTESLPPPRTSDSSRMNCSKIQSRKTPNRWKTWRGKEIHHRSSTVNVASLEVSVVAKSTFSASQDVPALSSKSTTDNHAFDKEQDNPPLKKKEIPDNVTVTCKPSLEKATMLPSQAARGPEHVISGTEPKAECRNPKIMDQLKHTFSSPEKQSSRRNSTPETFKRQVQKLPPISRPSSAPITPALKPSHAKAKVEPSPQLARSISAVGRLGSETSSATPSSCPRSFRNVVIEKPSGSLPDSVLSHSHHPEVRFSAPVSREADMIRSGLPFSLLADTISEGDSQWAGCSQKEANGNLENRFQNLDLYNPVHPPCQMHSLVADEFPHLDIINDLLEDEHTVGRDNALAGCSSFTNFPSQRVPQTPNISTWGDASSSYNSRFYEREGMAFLQDSVSPDSHFGTSRGDFLPQASHQNDAHYLFVEHWRAPGFALDGTRNPGCNNRVLYDPVYQNLTCNTNGHVMYQPSGH